MLQVNRTATSCLIDLRTSLNEQQPSYLRSDDWCFALTCPSQLTGRQVSGASFPGQSFLPSPEGSLTCVRLQHPRPRLFVMSEGLDAEPITRRLMIKTAVSVTCFSSCCEGVPRFFGRRCLNHYPQKCGAEIR